MSRPSLESFWENPYSPITEFPDLNPSKGLLGSSSPLSLEKPTMVNEAQEEKGGFLQGALNVGKNIVGAVAKPFINLAAAPVQGLAKAFGQPDPYQNFEEETGIPNSNPTPIDQPLRKLGSAGEVASYAFPYGRFAQLGKAGAIGGGALGGYGVDVASGLQAGESMQEAFKPGLGTALGTAIPGAAPTKNLIGKLIGETLGVSTGTGFGVIKQAFDAGKQGGKTLQAFTEGLRGRIPPDMIVQEARSALDDIVRMRREEYQSALTELTKNKQLLDISPIITELQNQLKKFGVKAQGRMLDFSQSALRFDKASQQTIATIFDEMRLFGTRPGDRSAIGVDSLKKALGDLYSDSSNVRSFVNGVKVKTKEVLDQIPGYEKLTKDYAERTQLIDEIQRGLSLGDQAMIDTTYKKLLSTLRLNNEQRREMVEALDAVSSGELLSKVAGQQMSEFLPRGIMRPLGLATAGGAAFTGFLIPLLKFAAFASPRLVGESLRTLGFADDQINRMVQAIGGIETLLRGSAPAVELSGRGSPQTQSLEPAPQPDGRIQRPPLETYQQ